MTRIFKIFIYCQTLPKSNCIHQRICLHIINIRIFAINLVPQVIFISNDFLFYFLHINIIVPWWLYTFRCWDNMPKTLHFPGEANILGLPFFYFGQSFIFLYSLTWIQDPHHHLWAVHYFMISSTISFYRFHHYSIKT